MYRKRKKSLHVFCLNFRARKFFRYLWRAYGCSHKRGRKCKIGLFPAKTGLGKQNWQNLHLPSTLDHFFSPDGKMVGSSQNQKHPAGTVPFHRSDGLKQLWMVEASTTSGLAYCSFVPDAAQGDVQEGAHGWSATKHLLLPQNLPFLSRVLIANASPHLLWWLICESKKSLLQDQRTRQGRRVKCLCNSYTVTKSGSKWQSKLG